MADLSDVSDATFATDVLQAENPTLVDFWAEWCGPCRMMASELGKLALAYQGKLNIVRMDVQASPDIPTSLGVMNIPTLILFLDGVEKERLVGYLPQRKIEKKIKGYLL